MHITVLDVFRFLIAYTYIAGFWQIISARVHKKGFEMYKEEGETFYDFMQRYYKDDFFWKVRFKLIPKWLFNSKAYTKFAIFKCIVLVLLASIMVFGLFYVKQTDYYSWLSIEF